MKEIVFVGMEIDKKAHEKKFGEIAKYYQNKHVLTLDVLPLKTQW